MNFSEFAVFLAKLEEITSRNTATEELAKFLNMLSEDEVKPTMYLLQGRVAPRFEPIEFGMSDKSVIKALALGFQHEDTELTKTFKQLGDVGSLAQQLTSKEGKNEEVTIQHVFSVLHTITQINGTGSQEKKSIELSTLLLQADPMSARYICRIVVGKLRLGFSDKTTLDALSFARSGSKSLRKAIEIAYGARADLGEVAKIVMSTPEAKLSDVLSSLTVTPGTPVAAKLVERESSVANSFERHPHSIVQPKLDGLRAQIHLNDNGETDIFSRNMESLTEMFPDICAAVKELGVSSIILDSEAIGYDEKTEKYSPFQTTITRRRKYGVEDQTTAVPIRAMTFDVLYLNGKDLTREPLHERIKLLQDLLKNDDNKVIKQLETLEIDNEERLAEYFAEQVQTKKLEGIIIKDPNSTYDPGTRNFDWIKLKANSQSSLVDTVDVVVLGYHRGEGARATFGIGTILMGVYNPETDKYYSVSKVGSGLKDEDWPKVRAQLDSLSVEKMPDNVVVSKEQTPDVWVRPEIVVEITADEITRSPSHTAAVDMSAKVPGDDATKGLSLRFPRITKWGRDKRADQATTVTELIRLYELRKAS